MGRKALITLNFVTRSTASATEMRSNGDSLNIKVVPLDDMKLSHAENPFTLYLAKIRCQHMPPCFSAKLACRKIICIVFDLRTMSTIHWPFIFLRAIIVYRHVCAKGDNCISAIAYLGFLPHTRVVLLQIFAIESSR